MEITEKIEKCLQSEKESRDEYYNFFATLENEWVDVFKKWAEVKRNRLLTKAFLRRVYLSYKSEELIGREIGRKRQRSISSDIENIFGQMLKAFLISQNVKNFSVEINSQVGDRQPDILVRHNTESKIVIELKNDLGYVRREWHKVMNDRFLSYKKNQIQHDDFFVIVLTVANWKTKKKILEEELRKWKGNKENFVFVIENPIYHPNPIKLPDNNLKKQDSPFDSLASLDQVVTKPSLENIFEKILLKIK